MALHYFRTSEQLRCLSASPATQTAAGWRAGALMLEKIAGAGGIDPALDADAQDESWRTATTLAGTLTDAELLDDALPPERLLYRLFHTEGVAADRARALVLWLPLLARAALRHPGGLSGRRPRPHGGRRRHRHDLRVLQPRFPLRAGRSARPGGPSGSGAAGGGAQA